MARKIATADNLTATGQGTVAAPSNIIALPWDNWVDPTVVASPINSAKVLNVDGELQLLANDQVIGNLDEDGMRALGIHAGWPTEFLAKLPADVQLNVINARLDTCDPKNMLFIAEDGLLKSVSTEWREVVGHKTVAQTAYDTLGQAFGGAEVKDCHVNGKLDLTLMTPRQDSITPKEGDVLQYGLSISHTYAMDLSVMLYMNRLWCDNGAYSRVDVMSWRTKALTNADSQINWLQGIINSAPQAMDNMTQRSQQMATTRFEGDPRQVLMERARAMGIPRSRWNDIWQAFEQEPGDSEWDLLNALTRFATHNESVAPRDRRRVQLAAGSWAQNFDIVEARLPRSLATRVGAQIIEHEEATN